MICGKIVLAFDWTYPTVNLPAVGSVRNSMSLIPCFNSSKYRPAAHEERAGVFAH